MRVILSLLLVACVLSFATAERTLGGEVDATLSAGSAPHIITFTVKNIQSTPLTILKWGTPLEATISDSIVTVDGSNAAYHGPVVKRNLDAVADSSVVTLQPNQEVSAQLDLAKAYSLKAGTHKIAPTFILQVVEKDSTVKSQTISFNGKTITLNGYKETKVINLASPAFDLTLTADAGVGTKKGGFLEERQDSRISKMLRRSSTFAPSYDANCDAKKTVLDAAVTEATGFLGKSTTYLALNCDAKDAIYKTWFGVHDAARRGKVVAKVAQVKAFIEGSGVKFDCSDYDNSHALTYTSTNGNSYPTTYDCDADTFAYVFPDDSAHVVYLCALAFDPSKAGTYDRLSSTIIHELSHFDPNGTTDNDGVYGVKGAKKFATNTPALAYTNADNFAYFHMEAYPATCPA